MMAVNDDAALLLFLRRIIFGAQMQNPTQHFCTSENWSAELYAGVLPLTLLYILLAQNFAEECKS
ncbi:MAG: hypothetical protein AB1394_03130 [Bacteroidota bacterium]